MHPDIAKAAINFLMRATLQGGEVPMFNAVMIELEKLAKPEPLPAIHSKLDN